jgi:hypothetical protein
MPGADTFEVYVGEKLMLKAALHNRKETPAISLDARDQQLNVIYNQCGETGTSRKMTLKNDQNTILKEWRFKDVDIHTKDGMVINVKDILAFKKANQRLSLYYSAKEREEVLLAPIQLGDKTASSH